MIGKARIGSKTVSRFTIPSGIVTTEVSCLERIAREVPEIGILTTKSIGPQARAGNREPILAQYMPGGFVNAVGLTNPGAEEFARKLAGISLPEDKFLLASIFGKYAEEFVYVARTLEDYVDGFELNLSCPHAKGYGMQLGQDPVMVQAITQAVAQITKKPIFAKLTPNAGNIGDIAKAAMSGGAYGIAAINTVGPGYYSFGGQPVLTNKFGGLSGVGIMPIGLKCVREIRQAIGNDAPIIGMGGINNANDVIEYEAAGATFFGIGSALAGMNEREIKMFLSRISRNLPGGLLEDDFSHPDRVDMRYKKAIVSSVINPKCDFRIIETTRGIDAYPGQFIFAWIPGVGEKPFSIMDNDPLTLGVMSRGDFTRTFNNLDEGDSFYFRGPYGAGINLSPFDEAVLVAGGCGIAGIYHFAKQFSKATRGVTILLGAKNRQHLDYLHGLERFGEVHVATEDGSLGTNGRVDKLFGEVELTRGSYFFNCGPRAMVEAVLPLELAVSPAENIYSSMDYMTRCGVGICGSCADAKGRRTCVEGPFMNP